ncbi:hypothetical protein SAMN04515667_2547 [Formosa sp. Hel1_31_208]|uniref:hypothetical protein n=1 Tax=Formosa sp. Hel1_31_208 TaxID=1798225 RepID=UPI000879280C|nr:hypothetical protein [Formosa sp. Hel1_31_208]SDS60254.1 hypothetical protein SAMN04515667_2547 [Formosa sp. Hel1_31_208]
MIRNNTLIVFLVLLSTLAYSQDNTNEQLPYYEVPEYSESFSAGTVAARMVDALGFRFYWASEGLNGTDLEYKPSEDVRSTAETIDHILDLSYIIVNSTLKQTNGKINSSEMSYNEKRKQVLINLKTAADILRESDDISQYKIIFGTNEIPFWNQVNGPIADAIWHCGQLASFRRSSGNPINSNVNHFRGTVKQ